MAKMFDIQRFSIHDGPGIRTILFMKGCSLNCPWCCNPESINNKEEIGFSIDKCIGCGRCMRACPYEAIWDDEAGKHFKRERCDLCEEKFCAQECPAKAIELFGREISVHDAIAEVQKDVIFFRNSHGGVTFSGGECLLQAEFVKDVLKKCKEIGVNTAIETSSCCQWSDYEKVIPYTDLFLCDVKHVNKKTFEKTIGLGYDLIMENLKKLSKMQKNIIIRTPVIPGFNDDEESIRAISQFVKELGVCEFHLLPYHRLGKTKYEKLGGEMRMDGEVKAPTNDHMETLCDIARSYGMTVQNGG
jgi:pyruvate formate lyase activating enzyme